MKIRTIPVVALLAVIIALPWCGISGNLLREKLSKSNWHTCCHLRDTFAPAQSPPATR